MGFVMCVCVRVCMCGFCNVWMCGFCGVWVCVCLGFVVCGCGCSDNCVGVLVIYVLVFAVSCVVCTVFLYCFVEVYLFLYVTSVRTRLQ